MPGPAAWLLAGFTAGIADYGLGLGFGLAAGLLLSALMGVDPRVVAASASAAQAATIIPAVLSHRRSGVIDGEDLRGNMELILALAVSSTVSASLASLAAARLEPRLARLLYALGLAAVAAAALSSHVLRGRRIAGADPVRVAVIAGAAAGAEKAVTGGGFTALLAAAQSLAGVDPRKALAMAPLAKLAPYVALSLVYTVHGLIDPVGALMLALGAAASAPLASRLLSSISPEAARAVLAASAVAGAVLAASRA